MSLTKTIKTYPAVGWVRATSAGSAELLSDINGLRKENEALKLKLQSSDSLPDYIPSNIAGLDDGFVVSGRYNRSFTSTGTWYPWKHELTWGELFSLIAPSLMQQQSDSTVEINLKKAILHVASQEYYEAEFDPQLFSTIKIQLKALGLVDIKPYPIMGGGFALFWTLTQKGERELLKRRTVKSVQPIN